MAIPTALRKHIPSAFKVGDVVRITDVALSSEGGWTTAWSDVMTKLVGTTGVITYSALDGSSNHNQGFYVEFAAGSTIPKRSFWFPSFVLELVSPKHNHTAFKVNDRVIVTKKKPLSDGCSADWATEMDRTLGLSGVVMAVPGSSTGGFYVRVMTKDGAYSYWYYSSESLGHDVLSAAHDATKFKDEDKVRVMAKVPVAAGWENAWESSMNPYVGREGVVTGDGSEIGFDIDFGDENIFSFPSTALMKKDAYDTMMETMKNIKPNNIETVAAVVPAVVPAVTAVAVAPAKKRRVRVGAGPWDAAPCSHLRWHLIGFFRSGLSLSTAAVHTKDALGRDVTVSMAAIKVCCKKCKTSMTMQASA